MVKTFYFINNAVQNEHAPQFGGSESTIWWI